MIKIKSSPAAARKRAAKSSAEPVLLGCGVLNWPRSERVCDRYGIGESRNWFNSRERLGGYVLGQILSCLKNGMPPHQVALTFIERFWRMRR